MGWSKNQTLNTRSCVPKVSRIHYSFLRGTFLGFLEISEDTIIPYMLFLTAKEGLIVSVGELDVLAVKR